MTGQDQREVRPVNGRKFIAPIITATAALIVAVGTLIGVALQVHTALNVEEIRHNTNSIMDARVAGAEAKGKKDAEDHPKGGKQGREDK